MPPVPSLPGSEVLQLPACPGHHTPPSAELLPPQLLLQVIPLQGAALFLSGHDQPSQVHWDSPCSALCEQFQSELSDRASPAPAKLLRAGLCCHCNRTVTSTKSTDSLRPRIFNLDHHWTFNSRCWSLDRSEPELCPPRVSSSSCVKANTSEKNVLLGPDSSTPGTVWLHGSSSEECSRQQCSLQCLHCATACRSCDLCASCSLVIPRISNSPPGCIQMSLIWTGPTHPTSKITVANVVSLQHGTKSSIICEFISCAFCFFAEQASNYLIFLTVRLYRVSPL